MDKDDMIEIKTLYVAQRNYPMVVLKSDEGYTRDAAGSINKCIDEFKKKYPAKDYQDCLAVIATGLMRRLLKYDDPLQCLDRQLGLYLERQSCSLNNME
ncbi:MAG: cell division protein ZapA [Prevotellaceae bacterium]|jgi:hypothetical protein|nr:cell division protein ZapA [Prevotellaceae bacterium]